MKTNFVARSSILMDASPSKVWEALTTPSMVKEYLFWTEVKSDWKVGSPIVYSGTWEGKPYEDKGEILEFEPEKRMVATYWSSFSGLPDSPENYQIVTYELIPESEQTQLVITQENVPSEESARHSESNWESVLAKLKSMLEK